GIVGEIDGLARRREQAKVRGRSFQHQVEFARRDVAVAGQDGSSELTCPTKRKSHALRARHSSRSSVRSGLQLRLKRVSPPRTRLATSCATTLTPRSST